jgi:excisionase family DNA binding protein
MEQFTSSLLTIQEMAARLRVPVSFLYSRTRQRGPDNLPVVRIGKYCRFDADEVLAYFARKQREGQPE